MDAVAHLPETATAAPSHKEERLAAFARKIFHYDPLTGKFTNKVTRGHNSLSGSEAGWLKERYRYLTMGGNSYLAHRVVWLWMFGRWPSDEIDHINGDKLDNRIANLRPASRQEQSRNSRRPSHNSSGFKGVSRRSDTGMWRAYIKSNGKQIQLGQYACPAAAALAYGMAADELFGEFARIA